MEYDDIPAPERLEAIEFLFELNRLVRLGLLVLHTDAAGEDPRWSTTLQGGAIAEEERRRGAG